MHVVVYMCNVIHKTFFQLELIRFYLWTFKFVNMLTLFPMRKKIDSIT
jgi:hypothetical protein